jgi:hypothetical protein
MKNSFNIDRYLNEAEEKFSGFYGDDYDDFDGNDFDLFEGEDDYSMATGGGMDMVKSPSPYQLTVTNTTAGALTLVMFGNNQFLLSTNFGSSVGLTVTPAQSNVSYLQLLQQSASQPFETSLIRVQSSIATQVTQILTVTITDANGQSGILDVPYSLKIDANTSITSTILAGAVVTYTFFPAEKVNVAKGLAGSGAVQVYGNPQVNLGGMTFPKRPNTRSRRLGNGSNRR